MELSREYENNSYQRNQSVRKYVTEFLATVIVPVGFILSDTNYKIYLTLDKQDVSEVGMTQSRICGPSDDCTTINSGVLLNGNISYNVIMEHFRADQLLESENLTKITAFDDYGNIYVNKILRYGRGRETNIPMPEYSLIPVKGEEFITLSNGQNIFSINNKSDFIMLLGNPNIEKVIHIPYRLFIVMKYCL